MKSLSTGRQTISQPIFLVKLLREAFRFPIKTHLNRRRQECLLFPGYSGAANRSAWNGRDLARIKQHQNKQTISQTIASRQFEAAAANCGRRAGGISKWGGDYPCGRVFGAWVVCRHRDSQNGFALVWMQGANRYVPDKGPSSCQPLQRGWSAVDGCVCNSLTPAICFLYLASVWEPFDSIMPTDWSQIIGWLFAKKSS